LVSDLFTTFATSGYEKDVRLFGVPKEIRTVHLQSTEIRIITALGVLLGARRDVEVM
jgi:hypothetical protein